MTDITLEQRAAFDSWWHKKSPELVSGDWDDDRAIAQAAWEAALRLSAGADASQWRPIHELDPSDDLYWFTRGDTVDGPRESRHDDADYWDFFAPVKWPALPAAPRHETGEVP